LENDVYTEALGENISNAEEKHGDQHGDRNDAPDGRQKDSILDLVYGVLFEPARTFAGLAKQPPVTATAIIVVLLNLAEALMELFTMPQYMPELPLPNLPDLEALVAMSTPLFAAGGFFLGFVKWFFMAGLLHLLAELYGGRGDARGVFTVYGLAGLPAALMIPVELLTVLFAPSAAFNTINGLLSLAVFIWSVVLLIIGIREVHGFSSGKAALTVFTPALAIVFMLIVGLIMFGSVISTIPTLNL